MPSPEFDVSLDTYPGGKPPEDRTSHPADSLIHRHITKVLVSRGPKESTGDPDSQVSRRATVLFQEMHELGIDMQRIRIGSAIAQIDIGRQLIDLNNLNPGDFGAEA